MSRRLLALSAATVVLAPLWGATATAAPTAPAAQQLTWQRCHESLPALECTTLKVPLDYAKPAGPTIELALSRIRATDPAKRRGVLLLNPGGPGGSGLFMPAEMAKAFPASVLDRYDLVGFDPRGVGRSAALHCELTAGERKWLRPYREDDFANLVAEEKSTAAKCQRKFGAALPHITTRNSARDLDLVRTALGETKISYFGYSYGTYLGAVYTQLFPRRVDRFVLDSAVDPARVWRQMLQIWGSEAERAFERWTGWTAERDATFHLGATPKQVRDTFWDLVRRGDAKPIDLGQGRTITGEQLRMAIRPGLFHVRAGAGFVQQVRDAADGKLPPAGKVRLPNAQDGPPPGPAVPASDAAFLGYICADTTNWSRDPEKYRSEVIRDAKRYPVAGDYTSNLVPCAFWTPARQPAVRIGNSVPLLQLQNEWDSQTPLPSGEGLHRVLRGSRLLVVKDGEGHGVFPYEKCAAAPVEAYLVAGKLPAAATTSCQGEPPKGRSGADGPVRPALPDLPGGGFGVYPGGLG